jgi:endoglucanase
MHRRTFLKHAAAGAAAMAAGTAAQPAPGAAEQPGAGAKAAAQPSMKDLAKKLPRWRGFNLQEKFNAGRHGPFKEEDFAIMAEWGFDFVRLPMDYRCWTDKADPYKLNEAVLKEIDAAVELGKKHRIHVSLNLHRAPGYTVASPPEALNLWTDAEAQKQFAFQWSAFAKRYQGRPSTEVSFDLVNEPAKVKPADYAPVARAAAEAIWAVDAGRLVVSDGTDYGRTPVFELAGSGMGQNTRGYEPFTLTHYGASWVNSKGWPEPAWPLKQGNDVRDKAWLARTCIEPWKKLEAAGVGVHVGEWGVFNRTPHAVALAWMRDCLDLWREAGWGWAVWTFRGSFGPLDSDRKDVAYEDFRGHKLDRKMLEVLRAG